ncbi:MAG: hypothetical protein EA352_00265, partial [Gemmatimonadales bacterium]
MPGLQPPCRSPSTNSTERRPGLRFTRLPLAFLFLALLLVLAGWNKMPEEPSMSPMLFAFEHADEAAWTVVNDGVMGGRSRGFVEVEEGTLRFSGTLVTRGGGFTLVRAPRAIDLAGHAGVELRVRGSNREFELELDDEQLRFGRRVSRRAPFMVSEDWTVVRVPFSSLRNTIFGQSVSAPPIDLSGIQSVAIYLA